MILSPRNITISAMLFLFALTKAEAAPIDYTVTYDYSANPIFLEPGAYPHIVVFDFGKRFSSYEDIFVSARFNESNNFVVKYGFIFTDQNPVPSYAVNYPWGPVYQGGVTVSVTPSSHFTWNSGWDSQHWIDVGAPEISQENFDGVIKYWIQNAPYSQTPFLSFRENLTMTSLSMTIRGIEAAVVPVPASIILMISALFLSFVFFSNRRQNRKFDF